MVQAAALKLLLASEQLLMQLAAEALSWEAAVESWGQQKIEVGQMG